MRFFICLMYHQTTSPAKNKYYVSLESLERQLRLFKNKGLKSWDIETKTGDIMLTFDDGHYSNYKAAQLLIKYGYKGYFYVVKDYSLKRKDYLGESEIKAISAMGHYIGVHGKDHKWWTQKTREQLIQELEETKVWIESLTGKKVLSCAAPGGVLNTDTIDLIRRNLNQFKILRTVKVGINNEDNYLVNIIPIHTKTSILLLKMLIDRHFLIWFYLKSVYYSKYIIRKFI